MKVRKSLFAVLTVGLVFGNCYVAERANRKVVAGSQLVADGGDPMPLPKPTRGGAIALEQEAPVLVADGGDPMPRPPRKLA